MINKILLSLEHKFSLYLPQKLLTRITFVTDKSHKNQYLCRLIKYMYDKFG